MRLSHFSVRSKIVGARALWQGGSLAAGVLAGFFALPISAQQGARDEHVASADANAGNAHTETDGSPKTSKGQSVRSPVPNGNDPTPRRSTDDGQRPIRHCRLRTGRRAF